MPLLLMSCIVGLPTRCARGLLLAVGCLLADGGYLLDVVGWLLAAAGGWVLASVVGWLLAAGGWVLANVVGCMLVAVVWLLAAVVWM